LSDIANAIESGKRHWIVNKLIAY